ncbi:MULTISPECIES: rhomboid family intramembrane serine protease GlpG [unclassified Colwellia]|jgi:GlpG protein|uniref:rhomboid family intramembrane serine protease GlpG n=1 Tax=unclassified Colwellia TaxID=196834 RepID=UPI0015F3F484|nr:MULTISPECIES: rhomboid family intramembrane serine protease GlpG [unclassified Colwellia]MBA6336345.1 rhomboid family intramembrane serine protease GlpG [Colwellia sp. BRX8-7]MBA6348372.1 rhomboid family intramembrane serine protease GlpG [Colwellia sp. BRX8-9]MBA6355823.1 rhomboid family intramembrane serine protease GlpG [Colwellia sp. BRX8-3]MBA6359476.1 rhomboid family intramembrane serine protease GlpG [Colwellia sp. BRX8-6]MBA6366135.1 rhomboid family intramembrane serine protease Glp
MSEYNSANELSPLVQVKQHNIALLFANYLTSLDIDAKVQKDDSDYVIYCASHKIAQAKEIFAEFIADPYQEKYQQAAWQSGQVSQVQDNSPSLITSFKQQFLAHAGVVTLTVFALCWLVFIASLLGFARPTFELLHFYPKLTMEAFFDSPLRLLGPALFHFSWLHIVFNTMWWWQLGGSVERTLGKGALINLFLITALLSNLGQFMVSGPNFGGLSGVVYGLVGYVWWYGWLAPEKGLMISKPIIGFLLFWLLLGYADVLPVNMANTAHLLGLVSGCLLAAVNVLLMKRH